MIVGFLFEHARILPVPSVASTHILYARLPQVQEAQQLRDLNRLQELTQYMNAATLQKQALDLHPHIDLM